MKSFTFQTNFILEPYKNIVFIAFILIGTSEFFLSCAYRWKSLTISPSEKAGHGEAAHSFKFFRALAPEKVANVYAFMFCATYRK